MHGRKKGLNNTSTEVNLLSFELKQISSELANRASKHIYTVK
jgi:hypothetical protein